MNNARGSFYRPELDILRFGAFLLVFLHHALPHATIDYFTSDYGIFKQAASLLAGIARAGALGVDLFFALSAYLITELLLRERRSHGAIDIRAFYIRRILRIWPLYYFALLILSPRHVDPAGRTHALELPGVLRAVRRQLGVRSVRLSAQLVRVAVVGIDRGAVLSHLALAGPPWHGPFAR